MSRKKRLAVFASGTGSNFEAIVTACEQGKIPAETVALVCDCLLYTSPSPRD